MQDSNLFSGKKFLLTTFTDTSIQEINEGQEFTFQRLVSKLKSKPPPQLELADKLANSLNGDFSITQENEIQFTVTYTNFDVRKEIMPSINFEKQKIAKPALRE